VLLLADRVPGVRIERQGEPVCAGSPHRTSRRFEAALEARRLDDAVALGAATLLEGLRRRLPRRRPHLADGRAAAHRDALAVGVHAAPRRAR
jgi:hypothetical protein